MFSSSDFLFLQENGYTNSFSYIDNAMKYYNSDPQISCHLFRKVLESLLKDYYSLFGNSPKGHIKRDIDNLSNIVPDIYLRPDIINEMNILRTIGNNYTHENNSEQDPLKDRVTCYYATMKISKWLIECKHDYPNYLRKLEEKRKKKKEKVKRILTIAGGGIIAVAALIIGGKKIIDK